MLSSEVENALIEAKKNARRERLRARERRIIAVLFLGLLAAACIAV